MRAGTRRVAVRAKAWLILAIAIAMVAVACDSEAGSTGEEETSPDTSFLDPIANPQDIQDLFVVEADDGEYWRFFTLDMYDGGSWSSADPQGSEGVPVSLPALLPRFNEKAPLRGTTLVQTFRILGDIRFGSANTLPTAQTAERIAGPIGDITWDPVTGVAFHGGDLEAGMTYTVRSRIVVPTPQELDRIDLASTLIDGRWTALPEDLDPRIAEIAKQWTAGATTDYRKVLAIQERFQRDDFVYSTAVDTSVGDDGMVEFLTHSKSGFCVHYSSAMALMVRTLGLPSRIGVGFRAGTMQEDGGYLVTTNDAHVWVEVLFPGYGWLQFEPEHGTAHPNALPGTYLNPT
jgi:hypothetical protein